jgi:integrase
VRRVIERDINPVWRDRLAASITRRDASELIDGVADRGALTMARRIHAHLHRLFRWAVGRGIIEINPMADLPKPGTAVKRDRVLIDRELAAIWKAAATIGWPFGSAVQLLILTATRREEVGSLRWSEIHGDEIRIPGERSKSGEQRTIPLSSAALRLIGALPRIDGDGYVFTTTGSTAISGWSKAKHLLDAGAAEINGGALAPWRLHDLRRTAATGLQRLGIGLQTIESVLGHVSGSRAGIVGVYQRHQFDLEKRAALEAWAREIDRIARGKKATPDGYAVTPPAAELTLSGAAPAGEIRPIDLEWLAAIERADRTITPEPLIVHLSLPGVQLGPSECLWLRSLLERVQFKRRKGGRYVPLGQKSQRERHERGAEHVRKLVRDAKAGGKKLSNEEAIDMVVKIYPTWFAADAGASLANFIKRGSH